MGNIFWYSPVWYHNQRRFQVPTTSTTSPSLTAPSDLLEVDPYRDVTTVTGPEPESMGNAGTRVFESTPTTRVASTTTTVPSTTQATRGTTTTTRPPIYPQGYRSGGSFSGPSTTTTTAPQAGTLTDPITGLPVSNPLAGLGSAGSIDQPETDEPRTLTLDFMTNQYETNRVTRQEFYRWLVDEWGYVGSDATRYINQVQLDLQLAERRRQEEAAAGVVSPQENFDDTVAVLVQGAFATAAREHLGDGNYGVAVVTGNWQSVQDNVLPLFDGTVNIAAPEGLWSYDNIRAAAQYAVDHIVQQGWWPQGLPHPQIGVDQMGAASSAVTTRAPSTLYDQAALAEEANALWQIYLLGEAPDPQKIANSYVSMLDANPNQAIDYQTFVLGQIRQDPAYEPIYRNKPAGVSERDWLGGYASQVNSLLGRSDQSNQYIKAFAGGGSTPNQITENLKYHPEATRTTGFANRVGGAFKEAARILG